MSLRRLQSLSRRTATSCGTRRRSSALHRRSCTRSAECSIVLRRSLSPRRWPDRPSPSTCYLQCRRLRPRWRRTPGPRRHARQHRSISQARGASCRTLWTRRSRGACGPLAPAGCAGRSLSRHGRAPASLSRKECERAAGVTKTVDREGACEVQMSALASPRADMGLSPSYIVLFDLFTVDIACTLPQEALCASQLNEHVHIAHCVRLCICTQFLARRTVYIRGI